jgi:hypothetical protein
MPPQSVTYYPAGQAPATWRSGDFLLIRNNDRWNSRNGFVSAVIRAVEYVRYRKAKVPSAEAKQLARWNHAVAVSVDSVSESVHLVEALGAGVARSPVSKYTNADYLYVATDLDAGHRTDFVDTAELLVGTKYGYFTCAAIVFRLFSTFAFVVPRTVICSGLVAACLGTYCWRAWPSWVMPSDLAAYHGLDTTTLLAP